MISYKTRINKKKQKISVLVFIKKPMEEKGKLRKKKQLFEVRLAL